MATCQIATAIVYATHLVDAVVLEPINVAIVATLSVNGIASNFVG